MGFVATARVSAHPQRSAARQQGRLVIQAFQLKKVMKDVFLPAYTCCPRNCLHHKAGIRRRRRQGCRRRPSDDIRTLDQPTIKAGETTFLVHNDAMNEKHEMVLLKLKSTTPKIVVTAAMGARKREKAERNRRSIRTEARRGWGAES
ncbi:hypothetical protein [Rhizobium sp. PL01]|uniref:hypothetical protein n=1 Tax=Rhizobium sp. PL01 TaxID=3085631 RepID=UPI00298169AE|nr:hypothetical protein [Rhizobium sp. PL01]MDW5317120.1 hypothetical protein [Rhizobium sp. PL01]